MKMKGFSSLLETANYKEVKYQTCRNAPLPIVVLPPGMTTLLPPSTGVIFTPDISDNSLLVYSA